MQTRILVPVNMVVIASEIYRRACKYRGLQSYIPASEIYRRACKYRGLQSYIPGKEIKEG